MFYLLYLLVYRRGFWKLNPSLKKNLTFHSGIFRKYDILRHLHHDLLKFSHVTEILNFHVLMLQQTHFRLLHILLILPK